MEDNVWARDGSVFPLFLSALEHSQVQTCEGLGQAASVSVSSCVHQYVLSRWISLGRADRIDRCGCFILDTLKYY